MKGEGEGDGGLDEWRRELKRDFERKKGYWHETWDQVLELDPGFFEQFSAVPFRHRESEGDDEGEEPTERASGMETGLSPKVKEFVYIAIECTTTHLYVPA